ncbi:hypothetical protein AM433_001043 [Pseudomonas aeruginosa]|nr:hypothetical protein AOY09_01615 [Pseudomonas aeruginosa]KRV08980.1 hypothetical protein AN457_30100 [Pseudomonas aeruginosa]OKN77285.1 hypothetical protein AM433_001043 [Pseudomonas aeruginosa]OKO06687.1 hypothetical protein AM482_002788 [Pseudomonas aeruginosa]VTQ77060.1 Uncharacterised protein [Pseudomonas aeruginosa]
MQSSRSLRMSRRYRLSKPFTNSLFDLPAWQILLLKAPPLLCKEIPIEISFVGHQSFGSQFLSFSWLDDRASQGVLVKQLPVH